MEKKQRIKEDIKHGVNQEAISTSEDDIYEDNGVGASWTAQEENMICKKYGLETLNPKIWKETQEPDVYVDNSNADISGLNSNLEASTEDGDVLGIIDGVTARRGKNRYINKAKKHERNAATIADKSFDPKIYLMVLHENTAAKDLEQGIQKLKNVIAQRSDKSKEQVKKYFAKFVNAKGTIDSFYKEMRGRNLISSQEYELQNRANKLYGPVLQRRSKAEKIRVALSILEQWRFFFNLPSSLSDMIKKGRFDGVVRDYKKGKSLMLTSFRKDESAKERGILKKDMDAQMLPEHYKTVFEKVWQSVDEIISSFREELFRQLGNMANPIETQEKIIAYLIDLDSKRDPLACYLETQYMWLMDRLVTIFNEHMKKVTGNVSLTKDLPNLLASTRESYGIQTQYSVESVHTADNLVDEDLGSKDILIAPAVSENALVDLTKTNPTWVELPPKLVPSDPWNLQQLLKAISSISSESFESHFGREIDSAFWKAVLEYVDRICTLISENVTAFWRTCKLYADGRLSKVKAADSKAEYFIRSSNINIMLKNVFELIKVMNMFLLPNREEKSELDRRSMIHRGMNDLGSSHLMNEDGMNQEVLIQMVGKYIGKLEKDEEASIKFFKAHPLIVCNYAIPISHKIDYCIKSILSIMTNADDGLSSDIYGSFESIGDSLVDIICSGWVYSAAQMHKFETWSFSYGDNSTSPFDMTNQTEATIAARVYTQLGLILLKSLSLIVQGKQNEDDVADVEFEIPHKHVEKIKSALFEAHYSVLDGYQWLVAKWRDNDYASQEENLNWCPPVVNKSLKSHTSDKVDKFGVFAPMEVNLNVDSARKLPLWQWVFNPKSRKYDHF